MNPRHTSSAKWTSLPDELLGQVKSIFEEAFGDKLSKGKLMIEGRIYPQELLFRVGYLESGRLQQANFEISMDFNPQKQNALEQIHFAIDCAASMMEEYFELGSLEDFPRTWQPFSVQGKKAFLQVSTVNTNLEAEADRLLGELSDDLVQGEDEASDREAVITMLGLGGEDDDDDEGGSNQPH